MRWKSSETNGYYLFEGEGVRKQRILNKCVSISGTNLAGDPNEKGKLTYIELLFIQYYKNNQNKESFVVLEIH